MAHVRVLVAFAARLDLVLGARGVVADATIVDGRVDLGPYCESVARTFTFDDLAIWTSP